MSTTKLAAAHGFADEFAALQRLRRAKGDPQPEDLLTLPKQFRRDVLAMADDTSGALELGLRQLIELVDAAPSREAELLRVAFNFDKEFGDDVWTVRVRNYTTERGGDEKTIREKVDVAILQLLQRTREAAEKYPELPAGQRQSHVPATVGRFFDQDYVRNSQEFVDAWTTASAVDICGFGHNRMLVAYSSEISKLLRNGGTIRLLAQDPEGRAVLDANYRSSTPKASEDDVRHQHRAAIAALASLQSSSGQGTVLLRTYDIVPPFTAYFFDAESDDAVAFIWFWSWRQASSWRPGFVVRKESDPLWFGRFYRQFMDMWNADDLSTPHTLEAK